MSSASFLNGKKNGYPDRSFFVPFFWILIRPLAVRLFYQKRIILAFFCHLFCMGDQKEGLGTRPRLWLKTGYPKFNSIFNGIVRSSVRQFPHEMLDAVRTHTLGCHIWANWNELHAHMLTKGDE